MRRNRIIYIAVVLGFLVFSITYQSRAASVLLVASLLYPLISLPVVLICSRLAQVNFYDGKQSRQTGAVRLVKSKGEQFDIWIYIRSRAVLPFAPIELECNLPDRDTGLFSAKRVYASVPPLGSCRISVPVMHRYRGAYAAQVSRISLYDPLRVVRIRHKISAEATLIFLPRRLDIGDIEGGIPGENSTSALSLLSGEKEDFSHVREYMMGDIMQLVHWKLTAKQDELMVKQFDAATECRNAVLCDYSFEGTLDSVMRQSDAVIEAAVALAMTSAKAGVECTVDLGTYSGEHRSKIKDMADFERFFSLMAVIPSKLDVMEFSELVGGYCRSGYSTLFLVTSNLTEQVIALADLAAEGFGGQVALVWLSLGNRSPLEAQAQEKGFVFLPVYGNMEI